MSPEQSELGTLHDLVDRYGRTPTLLYFLDLVNDQGPRIDPSQFHLLAAICTYILTGRNEENENIGELALSMVLDEKQVGQLQRQIDQTFPRELIAESLSSMHQLYDIMNHTQPGPTWQENAVASVHLKYDLRLRDFGGRLKSLYDLLENVHQQISRHHLISFSPSARVTHLSYVHYPQKQQWLMSLSLANTIESEDEQLPPLRMLEEEDVQAQSRQRTFNFGTNLNPRLKSPFFCTAESIEWEEKVAILPDKLGLFIKSLGDFNLLMRTVLRGGDQWSAIDHYVVS